jgi:hypothetical protein
MPEANEPTTMRDEALASIRILLNDRITDMRWATVLMLQGVIYALLSIADAIREVKHDDGAKQRGARKTAD